MPKILSDTIIDGTLNVQNVEHNGDNVRIVVSDQSGKFYYFDVAASAYKKKHFLSFSQEDILSPKQLDFKLLDPGDLNLSSAFRLIGSPNALLNSQEIELGEGLAFENNKLVSTLTGVADTYYYYSGESMQPSLTYPGGSIPSGGSGYIFLYKHGIYMNVGAHHGSFTFLFHCYHQISASKRILISATKTVEFALYVEQQTGQARDISGALKVVASSGSYTHINPMEAGSNRIVEYGILPDDAILLDFDPLVSSGKPEFERIKITNWISSTIGSIVGAGSYPIYTKYNFKTNNFVSPQTTQSGDEE